MNRTQIPWHLQPVFNSKHVKEEPLRQPTDQRGTAELAIYVAHSLTPLHNVENNREIENYIYIDIDNRLKTD